MDKLILGIKLLKGIIMAKAKKGSCGGTPRVGKVGDAKPRRGGNRRSSSNSRKRR